MPTSSETLSAAKTVGAALVAGLLAAVLFSAPAQATQSACTEIGQPTVRSTFCSVSSSVSSLLP
jgi:hypothetical protein